MKKQEIEKADNINCVLFITEKMHCLPFHSNLKEEICSRRNFHGFSKFDTNSCNYIPMKKKKIC